MSTTPERLPQISPETYLKFLEKHIGWVREAVRLGDNDELQESLNVLGMAIEAARD